MLNLLLAQNFMSQSKISYKNKNDNYSQNPCHIDRNLAIKLNIHDFSYFIQSRIFHALLTLSQRIQSHFKPRISCDHDFRYYKVLLFIEEYVFRAAFQFVQTHQTKFRQKTSRLHSIQKNVFHVSVKCFGTRKKEMVLRSVWEFLMATNFVN